MKATFKRTKIKGESTIYTFVNFRFIKKAGIKELGIQINICACIYMYICIFMYTYMS